MTMATKIKEFDFGPQSRLSKRGGTDPYPWDQWFDGDVWEIKQGEDFDLHPLMMERIIRSRIVGREGRVTLRHVGVDGEAWDSWSQGSSIILQRTDIEGPSATKKRQRSEARAAKKTTAAEVSPIRRVEKPAVKAAPALKKAPAKVNGSVSKRVSKRVPQPA
jgi:hypothetical protein